MLMSILFILSYRSTKWRKSTMTSNSEHPRVAQPISSDYLSLYTKLSNGPKTNVHQYNICSMKMGRSASVVRGEAYSHDSYISSLYRIQNSSFRSTDSAIYDKYLRLQPLNFFTMVTIRKNWKRIKKISHTIQPNEEYPSNLIVYILTSAQTLFTSNGHEPKRWPT